MSMDCSPPRPLPPTGYVLVDFAAVAAVPCPCGWARRAFAEIADFPGTVHLTEITGDARRHYHRRLTETYFVLDCEPGAQLQLDDTWLDLRPGMCILIRPLTRHCARGKLKLLNIVFPKFDAEDEWFD